MVLNIIRKFVAKNGYKGIFNAIIKDMKYRLEWAKKRKNRILIDQYRNALNRLERLSETF